MNALPVRLLFRVSTNSTGPSTISSNVASPGAPTCSVPNLGRRSIARAGLTVAIPSLIAYRFLRGKVERLVVRMEKEAMKLVDTLDERGMLMAAD